ncbi:sodium:solute symporter family transporter [Defluviicoccus vanus]|uniref:Cation/acetate symporter ActP n=1 Tax=Defluviicoccus vanus TaxID=111831 RepID=A0A7H1MXY2_9PROT|nr:cation/acetate symporter ActP [Defluviicoccus vanus]
MGSGTNYISIIFFFVFVSLTLGVTYWAAKKTKTTEHFYAAGRSITGFQNGLALAGDYMSAASFLGIAGLVALNGFDGLIYSTGWLVGWPIILFLIAEPLRNLGKYTFTDVVAYRLQQKPVRLASAIGTMAVVLTYLIAQMVGSGTLIKLLFGLDYTLSVIIVGCVMMTYVLFGGMIATTWVQIIKACLLLGGATFMALLVLSKFGFNPTNLFAQAAAVSTDPNAPNTCNGMFCYGAKVLAPGTKVVTGAWDAVSLGMALMFGTAGLPHILMRFYTVPNAKAARVSVMWATIWIGGFYLITFILGFGAMVLVGQKGILDVGGGGNMAAPLLAKVIAGDMFFGFICAVAFATILAVVAGLTLAGAGALSHDLWVNVIRGGHAPQHEQMVAARVSSVILGVCAVLLGIVFEGQNVAYMVGLTFSIAASANFPALVMSVFWRKFTTWGAVCSILFGTFATLILIYCGPTIQFDLLFPKVGTDITQAMVDAYRAVPGMESITLGSKITAELTSAYQAYIKSQWWFFPLKNPCLFTMTGAFLVGIIVSLLAPERSAFEGFSEVERRAVLGEPRGAAAE